MNSFFCLLLAIILMGIIFDGILKYLDEIDKNQENSKTPINPNVKNIIIIDSDTSNIKSIISKN